MCTDTSQRQASLCWTLDLWLVCFLFVRNVVFIWHMRLLITLLLLNFVLLLRGMFALLPPLKKKPKEGMKGKVARKSNCTPENTALRKGFGVKPSHSSPQPLHFLCTREARPDSGEISKMFVWNCSFFFFFSHDSLPYSPWLLNWSMCFY